MPGKRLTVTEREEIAVGADRGERGKQIAARLGRSPTTVRRERRRDLSPSPRAHRAFPARIRASAAETRPSAIAPTSPPPRASATMRPRSGGSSGPRSRMAAGSGVWSAAVLRRRSDGQPGGRDQGAAVRPEEEPDRAAGDAPAGEGAVPVEGGVPGRARVPDLHAAGAGRGEPADDVPVPPAPGDLQPDLRLPGAEQQVAGAAVRDGPEGAGGGLHRVADQVGRGHPGAAHGEDRGGGRQLAGRGGPGLRLHRAEPGHEQLQVGIVRRLRSAGGRAAGGPRVLRSGVPAGTVRVVVGRARVTVHGAVPFLARSAGRRAGVRRTPRSPR
ncbi:helix-turn-helix domain-containing protein [Nocardiopsis sp. CNT-189]